MANEHTPGPWEALTGPGWGGKGAVAGAGVSSRIVCYVKDWGFPEESAGNLRLIATAPELLAEMESLVEGNYGQPRGVTVPALDNARALIARAKGQ